MSYFSKTDNHITNSKKVPSTPLGNEENNGTVFNTPKNPTYNFEDEIRFFSKDKTLEKDQIKEELTREEEDKFYKKVFRTSLI